MLRERQFSLASFIQDLQQPTASQAGLPAELLLASPQLLPGLQAELACINEELERDQLVPASPAAQGGEH